MLLAPGLDWSGKDDVRRERTSSAAYETDATISQHPRDVDQRLRPTDHPALLAVLKHKAATAGLSFLDLTGHVRFLSTPIRAHPSAAARSHASGHATRRRRAAR